MIDKEYIPYFRTVKEVGAFVMQVTSKFVVMLVFIIGVSSQSRTVEAQRGSFQPRTASTSRVIKLQNAQANQGDASQIVVRDRKSVV